MLSHRSSSLKEYPHPPGNIIKDHILLPNCDLCYRRAEGMSREANKYHSKQVLELCLLLYIISNLTFHATGY